jgi:hypothetical protein
MEYLLNLIVIQYFDREIQLIVKVNVELYIIVDNNYY